MSRDRDNMVSEPSFQSVLSGLRQSIKLVEKVVVDLQELAVEIVSWPHSVQSIDADKVKGDLDKVSTSHDVVSTIHDTVMPTTCSTSCLHDKVSNTHAEATPQSMLDAPLVVLAMASQSAESSGLPHANHELHAMAHTRCSMLGHKLYDDDSHVKDVYLHKPVMFYVNHTSAVSFTCRFVDAKLDTRAPTKCLMVCLSEGFSVSCTIDKLSLMVISGMVIHATYASLMASSLKYLWPLGAIFTLSPQLATPPWPPDSSQLTREFHRCSWTSVVMVNYNDFIWLLLRNDSGEEFRDIISVSLSITMPWDPGVFTIRFLTRVEIIHITVEIMMSTSCAIMYSRLLKSGTTWDLDYIKNSQNWCAVPCVFGLVLKGTELWMLKIIEVCQLQWDGKYIRAKEETAYVCLYHKQRDGSWNMGRDVLDMAVGQPSSCCPLNKKNVSTSNAESGLYQSSETNW